MTDDELAAVCRQLDDARQRVIVRASNLGDGSPWNIAADLFAAADEIGAATATLRADADTPFTLRQQHAAEALAVEGLAKTIATESARSQDPGATL